MSGRDLLGILGTEQDTEDRAAGQEEKRKTNEGVYGCDGSGRGSDRLGRGS